MSDVGVYRITRVHRHTMPLDLPPSPGSIPRIYCFRSRKEKVVNVVRGIRRLITQIVLASADTESARGAAHQERATVGILEQTDRLIFGSEIIGRMRRGMTEFARCQIVDDEGAPAIVYLAVIIRVFNLHGDAIILAVAAVRERLDLIDSH